MSEVETPIVRPRPMKPGRMDLPLGRDPHSVRRRIEGLEYALERLVTVPVIGRKAGLDSIIGLVPVAGDLVTTALGIYLVWEARNLGLPRWKLIRMMGNVAVDSAIGAIPVAGDVFDFIFRSNSRNLRMLKRHLDKHHPLIEQ